MLLLCLRSKHRRNALETPEITQNPPSVLWKTFGEGSAQREIKLLTTTERGKELLRVFVAESCFYFKYCFVNMFVLLLCSEVLAQRKVPACWVLTKGHPRPPLDNIISWQASLGRHGWGGRQRLQKQQVPFSMSKFQQPCSKRWLEEESEVGIEWRSWREFL